MNIIKMPSCTKGSVSLVGDAGCSAPPAAGMGDSLAITGATTWEDAFEKHNAGCQLLHLVRKRFATTAADGTFSIDLTGNTRILVFSYTGVETQEMTVAGSGPLHADETGQHRSRSGKEGLNGNTAGLPQTDKRR